MTPQKMLPLGLTTAVAAASAAAAFDTRELASAKSAGAPLSAPTRTGAAVVAPLGTCDGAATVGTDDGLADSGGVPVGVGVTVVPSEYTVTVVTGGVGDVEPQPVSRANPATPTVAARKVRVRVRASGARSIMGAESGTDEGPRMPLGGVVKGAGRW